MSHTPTPWDENFKFHHYSEILDMYTLDEDEFSRAQTCVNACEGMKDPEKEINLLRGELDMERVANEINQRENEALKARVKELEDAWTSAVAEIVAVKNGQMEIAQYDVCAGLSMAHTIVKSQYPTPQP